MDQEYKSVGKKKVIGGSMIGVAVALAFAFLISGYFGYPARQESPAMGLADSEFQTHASDVIGTKVATTTTGVDFSVTGTGGQSSTSTYVNKIGRGINTAIYTIQATKSSSTANALFSVEGSNDAFCDTATSTTIFDVVTIDQINWFSAGDHLVNKVHATSFDNSSSTASILWDNPMPGAGNELILANLNYQCLRLSVSGSSTVLWAQLSTKK